MSQLDRPTRAPKGPRPAADEGQDPVDYRHTQTEPTAPIEGKGAPSVPAAAPEPATATATAPQVFAGPPARREQTVQLATRISPEVAALVDAAAARTGYTKRQIVEHAIRQTWAQ